jgi:N-acetylneuraminate synthase
MTLPRSLVIAEAGVNHNGSLDLALQLIDVAAEAGADAVKFQTFKADRIISRHAPKANYQRETTDGAESQLELVRRLELDEAAHHALLAHARKRSIGFLSTPFDEDSVDLLATRLGLSLLKLPSGEITNGPLLLKAARTGCKLILSTGMSTLGEIEAALGVLAFGYLGWEQPSLARFQRAFDEERSVLSGRVSLLHCTTEYPASFDEINLRAMDTMRSAFGLPVGLSDHSPGIAVAIGAVARGAEMIEKHFTLDRNLPGPDHRASLEPLEMKAMVVGIRQVEAAIGDGRKEPTVAERKNMPIVRKSLVAAGPLRRGELLTEDKIDRKRAGAGISPMRYWDCLDKPARRDYQQDEMLD